jgi:long-chain acyl-CoA synthetase
MDVLTELFDMAIEQSESQQIPAMEASTNSSTMADMLTLAAAKHAGSVALKHKVGEDWHEVTYAELLPIVRDISKALIANGITLGDKVAILANTRPEWTYADFGALCAGATVAPVYQTNSPEEVEYVLNHSEAKLVFVEDGEQLDKVKRVRENLKYLEKVVIFDPDTADLGEAVTLEEFKSQGQNISDDEFEQRVAAITPDDLCTIVYTSGTTGPPKGCMITHGNYRATATMGESTLIGDPQELIYLFLPLAHVFARLVQFVSVDVGATLAYWQKDGQLIIADVIGLQPDSLPSVPRIFEKIYTMANTAADAKSPEEKAFFKKAIEVGAQVRELQSKGEPVPAELQEIFDAADEPVYQNVRALFGGNMKRAVTGAAPIAAEILEFFFACGVPVFEGYGMTETSTLATSNNAITGYKIGSVGKPVPGCTVRIAEDGEIMVKGANIFQGYYKNDQATAETIDKDGWLHTGDLGMIDDDGFLFITGRKKDIIITAGGKNLTPANFENAMKQNRWVSQAVMYGDRRPYPVAIVTLDDEERPALAAQLGIENDDLLYANPKVTDLIQEVVDQVNTKFAKVEQVKKFRILPHDLTMESGDLTPSMKVKRNVVHEKYEDTYDAMYNS